jgi:hypothetical protein
MRSGSIWAWPRLGAPRQLARFYRATTIQIDAPAFSVQDHRWQP